MSLKYFFFYFELWWPFCSAERNQFCNVGRGILKEHSWKIISKPIYRFKRRCLLSKLLTDAWQSTPFLFLALAAILFRNFGKGALEKHFSEIVLKSGPWPRRYRLKCFLFFFLFFFSIYSSGGHFDLQSGNILALLVKGHERNISEKLFWNPATGLGGDVV